MDTKSYFKIIPSYDLTAAQIGISKWDWDCIGSSDEAKARDIMIEKRYDVLPIVEPDGQTYRFFCTREWNNYSSLNELRIDDHTAIYYRTSLLDLVKKFKEEGRHYYFLKDHNNIVGLVSLVNLNDPTVYNYLYQILADIERKFSLILKTSSVSEELILDYFLNSSDEHLKDIAKNYRDQKGKGLEISLYDHMYLQSIGIAFKYFNNKLDVRFRKLTSFTKKMSSIGSYNHIRNNIMHPVKSLITSKASLSQLNELLDDFEIIRSIEIDP
jgi:hypothetical protein